MAVTGKQVEDFTASRITRLMFFQADGPRRAALANLRKGIGRKPGDMPELWGVFLENMPEEMYSISGEPSSAEWAVYTALTLYALHQQGKDLQMSAPDISLGSAVAKLVNDEEEREHVWKRFSTAVEAADIISLAYYLRGLIQLLRAKNIPLDYPKLAKDLFHWQLPEQADHVRLRWGQDFYRSLTYINEYEEETIHE